MFERGKTVNTECRRRQTSWLKYADENVVASSRYVPGTMLALSRGPIIRTAGMSPHEIDQPRAMLLKFPSMLDSL